MAEISLQDSAPRIQHPRPGLQASALRPQHRGFGIQTSPSPTYLSHLLWGIWGVFCDSMWLLTISGCSKSLLANAQLARNCFYGVLPKAPRTQMIFGGIRAVTALPRKAEVEGKRQRQGENIALRNKIGPLEKRNPCKTHSADRRS